MPCSERFSRGVLRKEHNQKGYYLCPKTHVYTRETEKSLTRICFHCKKQVRYAHKESEHTSDDCPTERLQRENKPVHSHETFSVISIDRPQRYKIQTEKVRPVTVADISLEKVAEIDTISEEKARAKKIQTSSARFTCCSKDDGARSLGGIQAPLSARALLGRWCL